MQCGPAVLFLRGVALARRSQPPPSKSAALPFEGSMSDGEESLENLAEMLRQMQLNRMRLEAMQTTHAVLLQTRDGLVRVRPSLPLL